MTPLSYVRKDQWPACNASQGLHKERAACRYYQTGNCRRGPNCPFTHISTSARIEPLTMPHSAYPAENMYTFYALGQTPVYHPLNSPSQPIFLWQPYSPLSPSLDPRYGLVCHAENLPDYPDDKSDPSSAESSSTATTMDYQLRTALDTAWLEGVESGIIQGVAGLPGDLGSSLSPGYAGYSCPAVPGVQASRAVGRHRAMSGQCQGSAVALLPPLLPPQQDDSRKKPLAYKTKPCKFYAVNGKCTSGEKCTFIHDSEPGENSKRAPQKITPPTDARLPSKPVDKYDDYRARDFYPVTWRVIGGGVMMGGQRQICPAFAAGQCKNGDDCKFAHETGLATDEVGFIEPKSEPRSSEGSEALPQRPVKYTMPKRVQSNVQCKSVKAPPMPPEAPQLFPFPPTTPRPQRLHVPVPEGMGIARRKNGQASVWSAPPSPVHRRTQSMSMVATPPVGIAHSNYAAEL